MAASFHVFSLFYRLHGVSYACVCVRCTLVVGSGVGRGAVCGFITWPVAPSMSRCVVGCVLGSSSSKYSTRFSLVLDSLWGPHPGGGLAGVVWSVGGSVPPTQRWSGRQCALRWQSGRQSLERKRKEAFEVAVKSVDGRLWTAGGAWVRDLQVSYAHGVLRLCCESLASRLPHSCCFRDVYPVRGPGTGDFLLSYLERSCGRGCTHHPSCGCRSVWGWLVKRVESAHWMHRRGVMLAAAGEGLLVVRMER